MSTPLQRNGRADVSWRVNATRAIAGLLLLMIVLALFGTMPVWQRQVLVASTTLLGIPYAWRGWRRLKERADRNVDWP